MLTPEFRSGTEQLARAIAEADARPNPLKESLNRGESLPLADTVELQAG
ncbi:MAG: hypothetical protein OEP48_09435 [Betaproteobacteria bacterium]|nr:hypothetical protein [Betaproteobacteria bacterium]MDH3437402.1 hypothetical protein [Betaproteobacteria bacterium]